jgi:hypothetical protein
MQGKRKENVAKIWYIASQFSMVRLNSQFY